MKECRKSPIFIRLDDDLALQLKIRAAKGDCSWMEIVPALLKDYPKGDSQPEKNQLDEWE